MKTGIYKIYDYLCENLEKCRDKTANVFIAVLFLVLPIIYHNYYYDVVTTKYIFLVVTTLLLLAGYLVLLMIDKKMNFKFNSTDYLVIALFVENLISFLISGYKDEGINGSEGRNNGIVTIALYLIIYFCISRRKICYEKLILILGVSSSVVAIVGIMNFLDIDLLGFYNGLSMAYKQFYMSTIGHVDVYTSFFSITFTVAFVMYLQEKDLRRSICYYVFSTLNFLGILVGGCESAWLILLGIFFACLIINGYKMDIKFILFIIPIPLIRLLLEANNHAVEPRKLSSLMTFFGKNQTIIVLYLICVLLIVIRILRYEFIKKWAKTGKIHNWKYFKKIIFGAGVFILVATGILSIVLSVIYADMELEKMSGIWKKIGKYLIIKDETGSYRGYIWRILLVHFGKFSFIQKIFGIGPDSMYSYFYNNMGEKMYKVTDAYYDNAHNEYLQYLFTTGLAGIVIYLSLVMNMLRRALGKIRGKINIDDDEKLCRIAVFSAVCNYLLQALVNINQVESTPIFVVLMIIGICGSREKNSGSEA